MRNTLLILIAIIICTNAFGNCKPKAYAGFGYKFHEKQVQYWDQNGLAKLSARFGAYYLCHGVFRLGMDHHSQWFVGPPINDKSEYYKTELFVDYVFDL